MTRRDRSGDGEDNPLSFEQALAQLEAVVRVLEDGQSGLDESLAKYEEGVRLLKTCRESLQNAERKIMLLTGLDADGNPVIEPFPEEASTLEEKKESRARRRSRTVPAGDASNDSSENAEGIEGTNAIEKPEVEKQKGLF